MSTEKVKEVHLVLNEDLAKKVQQALRLTELPIEEGDDLDRIIKEIDSQLSEDKR